MQYGVVLQRMSRFLFERFSVLVPPMRCELCGGRHWTHASAVRCWSQHFAQVCEG